MLFAAAGIDLCAEAAALVRFRCDGS